MTTRAMGEEGGEAPVPNLMDLEKLAAAGGLGMMATTQAVGEEEGDIQPDIDLSTLTKRPGPGVAVTRALGEMPDGSINPDFAGVLISEADLSSLSPVTMAIPENSGDPQPDYTPMNPALTMAIPENAGDPQPPLAEITTAALGEEGNPPLPPELDRPPVAVTQALGEQPGDVMPQLPDPGPVTQAIPENAGDPIPPLGVIDEATTMAVGEEGNEPLPPGIGASATLYPQPNYPMRPGPMNPGGLASLVQLPMFQEFAQQLHEAHPEQSALFSQMFMGGMQRPMMRPPMFGMGFGGGFSPYMNMMGMGRPMMPPPMMYGGMPMGMGYGGGYGGYGMGSPFMGGGYGYGMGLGSFYQQPQMPQQPQQAPQPSTYSPAQPQQTNANYQPPQSPSPFGGALRGYYA